MKIEDNKNNDKKNEYETVYINVCSKETIDYINCVHNETYGMKCDKMKLLNLFLDCHHGKHKEDKIK